MEGYWVFMNLCQMESCGRAMVWVVLVLVGKEVSQGLHCGSCGEFEVHNLVSC